MAAEYLANNSSKLDVYGAVENHIRGEVDQQQTVGDFDGGPETEVGRPITGNRLKRKKTKSAE